MSMHKSDYELIAQAIEHEMYGWGQPEVMGIAETLAIKALAEELAERFEANNPKFDRAKFLSACGIETEIKQ